MRLRVGLCYQNVQQVVEPFSGKGKVSQVVFAALRYSEEHELLRGVFIQLILSACLVLKPLVGQKEVEPLLLGGFRQFGLVPSVSVLADFALLKGRLSTLQLGNRAMLIQGCCFQSVFRL